MKITCALSDFDFNSTNSDLNVVLYGRTTSGNIGSIGAAIKNDVMQKKLSPHYRAWDFLSIALSVISADAATPRQTSPDGWTRRIDLTISVVDKTFWTTQKLQIQKLLAFLTTDIWCIDFVEDGFYPKPPKQPYLPNQDCCALLSGGLDSLIGVIDLVHKGKSPFTVSQRSTGDSTTQLNFIKEIGEGLDYLQLNHNVRVPNKERPQTQRARSILFMAYGIIAATSLRKYHRGEEVVLYVCENGFISINPSLSTNRLGSLSTRTTHPVVLSLIQQILNEADINIKISNPYRFKTKGEMLEDCEQNSPNLISRLAYLSTSCGRFTSNKINGNYVHCGRCVPCIIRRAALHKWKGSQFDKTTYRYKDLSKKDSDHSRFDDVRAVNMAVQQVKEIGLEQWLGASMSSEFIDEKESYNKMIERGLREIESFLTDNNIS